MVTRYPRPAVRRAATHPARSHIPLANSARFPNVSDDRFFALDDEPQGKTPWRARWDVSKGYMAVVLAIITVVLIAVVAVQAAAIRYVYPVVNWGSIADAFAAGAGLIAAVGTVGALWVAVRGWQHEVEMRRADDQNRLEAERRAQAELVTTWVSDYSYDQMRVTMALVNSSTSAVYDVEVHIEFETEVAQVPQIRRAPDTPIGPYPARAYVPVLPPGQWDITFRTAGTEFELVPVRLNLYFRDQRQSEWARDLSGRLDDARGPIFDVPKISEKLAREIDPMRLIRSDYIMVERPQLQRW